MRGADQQQNHIFSYLSPEERVRKDHPLRAIRVMVDEVLKPLWRRLDAMYAKVGSVDSAGTAQPKNHGSLTMIFEGASLVESPGSDSRRPLGIDFG